MEVAKHITPELSRLTDQANKESELMRAIKFYNHQRSKGWTIEEVLLQVLGSYNERVHYRINSMVVLNQLV